MEKEYKELLLKKDLCGRIPYGVKILHERWNYEMDEEYSVIETLSGIDRKWLYTIDDDGNDDKYSITEPLDITRFKPYLRSMSRMTEEEMDKYHQLCETDDGDFTGEIMHFDTCDSFDYLDSILVDYRGLIEKGLALEAPSGMYETK